MKLIITLLAILSNQILIGQTLFEFPQPGTKQCNVFSGDTSMPSGVYNSSIIYLNDTIINDKKYSFFSDNLFGDFYTRYDSGKVYVISPYNLTLGVPEILQYDFSLNLNDTFFSYSGPLVVDSIAYVSLQNGQVRKYLRLFNFTFPNYPFGYSYWIDGIGDINRGFQYALTSDGGIEEFVCHYDSSGLVYTNTQQIYNCDSLLNLLVNSTIDKDEQTVKIYPNPSVNSITVQVDKIRLIQIVDLCGKTVKRFINKCNEYEIDINDIPSGIYLIKIDTDNGIFTKKIIKNNIWQ